VMSYLVGQRTREMGIRLALGATPAEVRRLVIHRAAVLGALGVAAGLMAAIGLGRVMEHRLHYIAAEDPWILGVSGGVLLGTTLLACALPAWRASRIDPVVTLRQE
jgi:putative ABC transport system permease protein